MSCPVVSTNTVYTVSGPAFKDLPSGSTAILPGWCSTIKAHVWRTPATVCAGSLTAARQKMAIHAIRKKQPVGDISFYLHALWQKESRSKDRLSADGLKNLLFD